MTTTAAHPRITFPAYAADTLGESMTVTAPAEWHDRILAVAGRCRFGSNYSRRVVLALEALDLDCRDGYTALAYDRLLEAEKAFRR